jgi:hypothetical protein
MSQVKLFKNLIKSLTDPEFDLIAKLFLEEVDDIKNIINCNGPWDSGLDIRSINVSEIQAQFQITTKETGFENKLFDDLEKAEKNVKEYSLPNRVRYFYSHPLSNHSLLEFKNKAKQKYNLVLDITEASTIAEVAKYYDSIRQSLIKLAEVDKLEAKSEFFDNDKVRSFYDLMSIGSATDIKYNIVKSYIIHFLHTNGESNHISVSENVNSQFNANLTQDYFDSIFRRMNSENIIQKASTSNIKLTEPEFNRVESILESYRIEEGIIRKSILEIKNEFHIDASVDEIIIKLSELYESNYAINISEFTYRQSTIHDFEESARDIKDFLLNNSPEESDCDLIFTKLVKAVDNNDILSRIAVGNVFSKVSDPDRLEDFIRQHHLNKEVFLDTNVLINLLCVHYEPNAEYDDYNYKVAKQFLKFSEEKGLKLKTIRRYAVETTRIFINALNLIPFTDLPYFNALGKSSNVLYNFYLHLSDWNLLDERIKSFEDFMKEFRFSEKNPSLKYSYRSEMEYLLDSLNVEIAEVDGYNLDKTNEIIDRILRSDEKFKSYYAKNSDSIMLNRLGDPDVDINPIDPIFCTWDVVLMKARKLYFEEYPGCTKWFMYTPTRIMDHFSMMNFKVRSESLTNELLTILDDNKDFQERTQALIDSVKTIINPKNEIGLKYSNKLADLREKQIVQVDHVDENIPDSEKDRNAVDIVFFKLLTHYLNDEESDLTSLKKLFQSEEYFDDVIATLDKEINNYNATNQISEEFYKSIDRLANKVH